MNSFIFISVSGFFLCMCVCVCAHKFDCRFGLCVFFIVLFLWIETKSKPSFIHFRMCEWWTSYEALEMKTPKTKCTHNKKQFNVRSKLEIKSYVRLMNEGEKKWNAFNKTHIIYQFYVIFELNLFCCFFKFFFYFYYCFSRQHFNLTNTIN